VLLAESDLATVKLLSSKGLKTALVARSRDKP
jgi:hypothetical protein